MKKGMVSIIVPVYNVAAYLERCLESLVSQTYSDLEILCVDDGSTDGSREILTRLAQGDSRIKPLFQEKNQGVSAARNRALDEMMGEWVCFCDSDDWLELTFVEKMLKCAETEKSDYVICNYMIAYETRAPLPSGCIDSLNSGDDARKIIACGPLSSCIHMIHRNLFEASGVRYPVGIRQSEEMAVIPVLAKYASRIGVVHEPLYNYFQRGDGSSASNARTDSEKNFIGAHKLMAERLGAGYEQELEYHAIYALFYGEILHLCKIGSSTKQIKAELDRYEAQYPNFMENKYLSNFGRLKIVFLWMCRHRWILGLRILSRIHQIIIN